MESFLQDLRYAVRSLRKDWSIASIAVVSIALAVGANTTIYTWLDGLVLHPLPAVPAVDQIAQLRILGPENAVWSVSYPDLQDWRAQARSFTGISGYDITQASIRTTGQAERAFGMLVSANYFDVLQVRPFLGRGFVPAEDSAPGAHPVAVLSYGYWRRRFAADSAILNRAIAINGHPFTVIGVAPPRFAGNFAGLAFDFWAPLSMSDVLQGQSSRLASRSAEWIEAFGRLKLGVTLAGARDEMRTIEKRLAATYTDDRDLSATALGFGSQPPVVWFRPAFLALLGITGVVLLIACANVANLLLTRAAGRAKEMSIRVALGARRSRLVRQLLIESSVLAAAGGGLGLAAVTWSKGLFVASLPASIPLPISLDLAVSGRVIVFTLAVATLTVLLFGLVPALRGSRPDLVPGLKDDVRGRGLSRSTLRSSLAVAQVALSMIALVAAGLFARSLANAGRVERGFRDGTHVLLIGTDMQLAGYTPTRALAFYDEMSRRIDAVPGVSGLGLVANVPLGLGGRNSSSTAIEGYVPRAGENMSIFNNRVGPGYFAAMGTRIQAGREFTTADRTDGLPVAVVNQAFVDKYWPGQDAIGRHVTVDDVSRAVVGVVATGKYQEIDEPPTPFVFLPIAQVYAGGVAFVIRTTVPPLTLVEPLRREFTAADPNVPFLDPQTLEQFTGASVFVQRAVAWSLGAFGALALVLAAMGIYGVVSYGVAQRTREMGIRTALGAGRWDIVVLVLRQGATITAVGVVLGTAAAVGVAQLLRTQLLGVKPTDPATLAAIALLLAAVALVATLVPARRAAGVDPLVALRQD